MNKSHASPISRSFLLLLITMMIGLIGPAAAQTPASQPTTKPILLTDRVPDPEQEGVLYFPQTGHTLRGAFHAYWRSYGGLTQFGYPLTEEFFEEVGSDRKQYLVQYFERNRFEYHPENAGTQYEVLLAALGRSFHTQDPPASPLPPPAIYFKETAHNLSGAFKQYWEAHGGLFVHGYPITEPRMERSTNGQEYLVQWFERSSFELHPENAGTQYDVLLGLLGRQLSEKLGYPYGRYPLFGRAADYSWFAGYYGSDGRKCSVCGCKVVYFARSGDTPYYGDRPAVQPYGEYWAGMEKALILTHEPNEPQTFIVVFGQPDDATSAAIGKGTATCLSPKFKVTSLQFNPAH
jgi:hypothetical protein